MQIAKHGDRRDQQRNKIGFRRFLSSAAAQVRRSGHQKRKSGPIKAIPDLGQFPAAAYIP